MPEVLSPVILAGEEQSPVESGGQSPDSPEDYERVQRDFRKEVDTNKTFVSKRLVDYKPAALFNNAALQRERTESSEPSPTEGHEFVLSKNRNPNLCGLRRKWFFIILLVLTVAIVAVIIGVAVGITTRRDKSDFGSGSQASSDPTTTGTPATSSPKSNVGIPLSQHDPMPNTPLTTVAFTRDGGQRAAEDLSYRVYYQEFGGSIMEVRYDGALVGWAKAVPIFTDARRNTGLATFTFVNGTDQTTMIFYNNKDNYIKQKRKSTFDLIWQDASINRTPYSTGSSSLTENDNGHLRMAVVYSPRFSNGAGARLFHHSNGDGLNTSIQELIWDQSSDRWSEGATIQGVAPKSQIAATIDGDILRVFYSSGQRNLQESWRNISTPNSPYQNGIMESSVLDDDDGSIAAISTANSSTLVYLNSPKGTGIREFGVTRSGTNNSESVYTRSTAWSSTNSSMIKQPIGAVTGTVQGIAQEIQLFFVAPGEKFANTTIRAISRLSLINGSWPSSRTSTTLPLANGYGGETLSNGT